MISSLRHILTVQCLASLVSAVSLSLSLSLSLRFLEMSKLPTVLLYCWLVLQLVLELPSVELYLTFQVSGVTGQQ